MWKDKIKIQNNEIKLITDILIWNNLIEELKIKVGYTICEYDETKDSNKTNKIIES